MRLELGAGHDAGLDGQRRRGRDPALVVRRGQVVRRVHAFNGVAEVAVAPVGQGSSQDHPEEQAGGRLPACVVARLTRLDHNRAEPLAAAEVVHPVHDGTLGSAGRSATLRDDPVSACDTGCQYAADGPALSRELVLRCPVALMLEPIGSCDGHYRIVTASSDDVDIILSLRDEAASWMVERGINQWSPGELPHTMIEDRVSEESVFLLLRGDAKAVGTVTLLWSDELIWGERAADAGYVHMLIVEKALRGAGLGRALLAWAESHVAERGRRFARLDCVRDNRRLRDWYEDAGYVHLADKEFTEPSWARPVALYEKRV